jgi:hypothetical protein
LLCTATAITSSAKTFTIRALHDWGHRGKAVHPVEAEQCRQHALGSDFEDRAAARGTLAVVDHSALVACSVEIPVGGEQSSAGGFSPSARPMKLYRVVSEPSGVILNTVPQPEGHWLLNTPPAAVVP